MSAAFFKSGPFAGVSTSDPFAVAALSESPVIVKLPAIAWPDGLAPKTAPLGAYSPGEKITGAVVADVDVLIILYTALETRAFLEVFTGDSAWNPARQAGWSLYGHNFDQFKPSIQQIKGDAALEAGFFGYLAAFTIGQTQVAVFKSELHPKVNGPGLPFIPVIAQLVGELAPKLVISTGTAGAIGAHINCGDVAITTAARFHTKDDYPLFPALATLSADQDALTSSATVNVTYVDYAAQHFTSLSLPGLKECYDSLIGRSEYAFLKPSVAAPAIYLPNAATLAPQPLAIVSADYLTVDDNNDSEGL